MRKMKKINLKKNIIKIIKKKKNYSSILVKILEELSVGFQNL